MEKLKWHFKKGSVDFFVIWKDENFILVQNADTKRYSFGVKEDFGSRLGFPINWSYLTAEDAIKTLNGLAVIENQYLPSLGDIAKANILKWNGMITAIRHNELVADLSPIGINGMGCSVCGHSLAPTDKALICSDCGAVYCEDCTRGGAFEGHICEDKDEEEVD